MPFPSRRILASTAALVLASAATVAASDVRTRLGIRDTVFENGLRVIVYPDRKVPTVACHVFYATGSVHEHPGGTGIAHMLEHMLFKGTRKVGTTDSTADAKFLPLLDSLDDLRRAAREAGDTASVRFLSASMDSLSVLHRATFVKEELWQAYREAGGTNLNAFTTDLGTAYHVTLPRNRFELFLWLESDRMRNAVLRDFHSERDVVREERRMRVENRPQGRYWETMEAMFWGAHPYGIPTIGYQSDIENYRRSQAQEHYDTYYGPRNAVLVFAGDISVDTAFAQSARYFGGIRKGAAFPKVVTRDPEPVGQKRLVSIRDNARPNIDILFPVPAIDDPEAPAFEILEGVLSGASGRLEKILSDSLRLVSGVGAWHRAQAYAGQFVVTATPVPGADPAVIEKVLWDEIAKLRDSLLAPREIARVKNRLAAAQIGRMRNLEDFAVDLGLLQLSGGWRLVETLPEATQAIEAAKVREAAAKWLRPERATVGWLLPKNHSEHTRTGVYLP